MAGIFQQLEMKLGVIDFAIRRPKTTIAICLAVVGGFMTQFPRMRMDTDPKHMLNHDEPVLGQHRQVTGDFKLYDFVAVAIEPKDGKITPELLTKAYEIGEEIKNIPGVVPHDMISLGASDDIRQGKEGSLVIEPLMSGPVTTQEEVDHILSRVDANPILKGKLAAKDRKMLSIFVPIVQEEPVPTGMPSSIEELMQIVIPAGPGRRVAGEIKRISNEKAGGLANFYVAGLPVAEHSFGREMMMQMMVFCPISMMLLMFLTYLFFRNFWLTLAPMIIAGMSVMVAMGAMLACGLSVHLMSSMIPIFLMPIAVLDAAHIVSEFIDSHQPGMDRATSIRNTTRTLFQPIFYTATTDVAGFGALALTPIPPIQVFGIFIAVGVVAAWLFTITLLPAYMMLIPEKSIARRAAMPTATGPIARTMRFVRDFTARRSVGILAGAAAVVVFSIVGITKIQVNDNPTNWFRKQYELRRADEIMNAHLAGTYYNFLAFEGTGPDTAKNPAILSYIEKLEEHIEKEPTVGAATGLTDIVKKVRYELFAADAAKNAIPTSQDEVAQMIFLYEISGGDTDDLFHFVTPDYAKTNLWIQMNDGDNVDVQRVVDHTEAFLASNPLPAGYKTVWAGDPYINITWQRKMVAGLAGRSLIAAYAMCFVMMIVLFRSISWAAISMIPLTVATLLAYGVVGWVGKNFDMPIAVLSALSIGLAIDDSIHWIQRLRQIHAEKGDPDKTMHELFESTARATTRTSILLALGFSPMFFSGLVPFVTVAAFFFSTMTTSGICTMLVLPALIRVMRGWLMPAGRPGVSAMPAPH